MFSKDGFRKGIHRSTAKYPVPVAGSSGSGRDCPSISRGSSTTITTSVNLEDWAAWPHTTKLEQASQDDSPAESQSLVVNYTDVSMATPVTHDSTPDPTAREPAEGSSMESSAVSIDTNATSSHAETEPEPAKHTATAHEPRDNCGDEDDPLGDSTQIPGVTPSTYVYPRSVSLITEAFRDRYCEIVNLFRQNTEEHPRLRDHVQQIDYTLKMCGSSVDEIHPSILVFCRPSEFSALHTLLNSKHLKLQYGVRKSTPKYSWKGWRGRAASTGLDNSNKPLFRLYFWRQERPRELLKMTTLPNFEDAKVYLDGTAPPPNLAFAKALYGPGHGIATCSGGERTSVLGCLIYLGAELYALTAAHGVRSPSRRPTWVKDEKIAENLQISSANSATTTPGDDDSEDEDFVDDVEYLDLPEYASTQDDISNAQILPARDTVDNDEYKHRIQATALVPSLDLPETDLFENPDLDWALIFLPSSDFFPIHYPSYMSDMEEPPECITNVARKCPVQETNVIIVNSPAGSALGRLQPVPVFLGGINSNRPSTVWAVVLSDQNGKQDGAAPLHQAKS
jgi:hypothetical protein